MLADIWNALTIYLRIPWEEDPVIYNCSSRTIEEWYARGLKRPLQGSISIVLGSAVLILYIITLKAMATKEILKQSCYQMMYFCSVFDCFTVLFSNIIPGYFMIVGGVWCTHPRLNPLCGGLVAGNWVGVTTAIVSLAFSRLAEISGRGKWMFQGRMVAVWVVLASFNWLFVMFMTPTAGFNSAIGAYHFVPFITDDFDDEIKRFRNIIHASFNIGGPAFVFVTYFLIFILLRCRSEEKTFTSYQKKIFVQCSLICFMMGATSWLYAYLLLFGANDIVVFLAQATYQLTECMPLICYLTFNATIRRRVLVTLRLDKLGNQETLKITPASIVSNTETK